MRPHRHPFIITRDACRHVITRAPATLLLLAVSLAAPHALARPSAGDISQWVKNTEVQEQNPVCEKLTKTILGKVLSMSVLQRSIDKDLKEPAPSIAGLVKNWMGQPYTSQTLEKKRTKLEKERQGAAQLNGVLSSVGCPQVDIDAELKNAAAKIVPLGSQ